MTNVQQTLYFGYGSNLWLHQMSLRCPSSAYVGVARLPNYRWIINSRGYANIVPSATSSEEVFGLVYTLTPVDEAQLDINEDVPYAYTKERIKADFWPSEAGHRVDVASGPTKGGAVDVLVYIDRQRTVEDTPKQEYVHRMNMGVRDALENGIPKKYIDQAIRKSIPEQSEQIEQSVQELANKQAMRFEDVE